MNTLSEIEKALHDTGFKEFGYVEVKKLKYYPEVRAICEKNACGGYGASWACPPAIGTIEECKAKAAQYNKMIIFTNVYQLEDSFDYEGMLSGAYDFKSMAERFHESIKRVVSDYFLLANEGCRRCSSCTYPNAPCRFPDKLYPSLEGFGFIVSELAKEAGVKYNNGANTVTYFGGLLFNE